MHGAPPRGNALRPLLDSGGVALGAWCTLPTSFSCELVGTIGVDYGVVDMQHGLAGYSDLVPMLQALSLGGSVPMVRMPFGDRGLAQRALDAGALGLIVPMVNNVDDARAAVKLVRYPPVGERSYGPIRARLHLGANPVDANSELLCLVQIETQEAMTNLTGILAVDGIDGVYVGPADLALSHGINPGTQSDEVDGYLARIAAECQRFGRIPGIHTLSGADCQAKIALGYRMCSIGSDSVWLQSGYATQVAVARSQETVQGGGLY
jgi:4-hydroxy-2-oxoheptanedioate aldolase